VAGSRWNFGPGESCGDSGAPDQLLRTLVLADKVQPPHQHEDHGGTPSKLDLTSFEDPSFYDRMERAGRGLQGTDRIVFNPGLRGCSFKQLVTTVSLAAGILFLFAVESWSRWVVCVGAGIPG